MTLMNTDSHTAASRNQNKSFNHKGHKGYEGRAKNSSRPGTNLIVSSTEEICIKKETN